VGVAVLGGFRALEFFGKSIEIDMTNTYVKNYQHVFQKCGSISFVLFVGVRVGVATWVRCVIFPESRC